MPRKKPIELKNVNVYIEKALENISIDRAKADVLLNNIMKEILKQPEHQHGKLGNTAAKYIEILQKSNEQLIKLADLMKRDSENKIGKITDGELDLLYSEISKEGDSVKNK